MKLVESKALVFETEEYNSATVWNKRRVGVKVGGILVGMVEKATADNGKVEWLCHYLKIDTDGTETALTLPYSFPGPLGKSQAIGAILALTQPTE
jgi:hypothetical protein